MPQTPISKLNNLKADLKQMRSVLIAYSGGTDSAFLAKTAHDTLKDNAAAITISSPMFPQSELKQAKQLAKKISIKHIIIDTQLPEDIKENTENRCYHCKKQLFKKLKETAKKKQHPSCTRRNKPGRPKRLQTRHKSPKGTQHKKPPR